MSYDTSCRDNTFFLNEIRLNRNLFLIYFIHTGIHRFKFSSFFRFFHAYSASFSLEIFRSSTRAFRYTMATMIIYLLCDVKQ